MLSVKGANLSVRVLELNFRKVSVHLLHLHKHAHRSRRFKFKVFYHGCWSDWALKMQSSLSIFFDLTGRKKKITSDLWEENK